MIVGMIHKSKIFDSYPDVPKPVTPAAKYYLFYVFPEQKRKIAELNYDQKIEWYQTRDPKEMVFLGNSKEFQTFWKWNMVYPLKVKRFLCRVKIALFGRKT